MWELLVCELAGLFAVESVRLSSVCRGQAAAGQERATPPPPLLIQ